MPRRGSIVAVSLLVAMLAALLGATTSSAAPGNLRILIVSNYTEGISEFAIALAAEPGVAEVETFDSSEGTPTPASLSTYDLVVGSGDSNYSDPELWGNRLADYLDAGGAEIQFAYDNWEHIPAHPTGRFESGGYAPFVPGPNENFTSSLGSILVPGSPLLAEVPSFETSHNTTPTLAPGATLLANWENGKPAIATKGQVVSVSAAIYEGSLSPMSAAARLAVNAGNVLGPHTLTVSMAGAGSGTIMSTPAGISCGATCAFDFTNGTAVTLTATPSSGSSFAGWSGAGCSGTSTCTVTMDSSQAVTANFDVVPVPPKTGTALASRVAKVKGGKALLKLRCRGGGRCKGVAKLLVRRKLIGKARFSIALGKTKAVRVRLNRRGRKALARHHRLKAKLRGSGVKSRTVLLK